MSNYSPVQLAVWLPMFTSLMKVRYGLDPEHIGLKDSLPADAMIAENPVDVAETYASVRGLKRIDVLPKEQS